METTLVRPAPQALKTPDRVLPPAPVEPSPQLPVETPVHEIAPLSPTPNIPAKPAESILVSREKHAKRPVTDARVGRAILYYAQQKNARKLGVR